MLTLPVKDVAGGDVGSCEVDLDSISPPVNKQLLHDAVVMYEANRRVGTARTKSRAEVAGTTQKMYRQKGTGRARAGSRRSPVRVGGGRAFAKRPQDWSYRLNRKALKLATRMALRSKFEDEQATVLSELAMGEVKTKALAAAVKALGLAGTSVLIVIPEHDQNLWLSCRNLEGVQMTPASGLNSYDLLHQRQLVIVKSALEQLIEPAAAAAS